MYYCLKAPWAFRGWERTPYAVQAQAGGSKHKRPFFFRQQPFLDLLYCNGEEEVDPSALSAESRHIFSEFLANGILEQSERPMAPLESMTEDGDYLVPDQRICYFFKHIGEAKVCKAADTAIRAAGFESLQEYGWQGLTDDTV